jgi:hypothetical protein
VIATVAYVFTYNVPRGESQPELAGVEYDERIHAGDLPVILGRRTNIWLIFQGFTAQIALGSLVWLPILFRSRAEHQGYTPATAVIVGSVFATLFQLGGRCPSWAAGRRPAAAPYPARAGPGRADRRARRRAVLRGAVLRPDDASTCRTARRRRGDPGRAGRRLHRADGRLCLATASSRWR